ncbi:MAG: exosortase A [Gammaproteobacteria bacterium]|nr:exosortase A [Gammaproteobacteria bacterium]
MVITGIPLLFIDSTLSMIDVWKSNETFTHGFLIFPITLWLIWQKRQFLSSITPVPEPRVFILLVSILIAWFVSNVVDVQVTQQLAMITIIISLVWLILGRKVLIYLSFPLLFLFFAVPLGQGLIPVMMEFTAHFTVNMVKLTGIPIYQDGLFFSLPTGNWSVVEECSGVRYLIASVALGTIYAYTSFTSYRKRFLFIVVAIIVPILANGLRAFGIVMLGHFSGMELATGADHLVYGWVFFGVVIFIMFYIGSFWWDPVEVVPENTSSSTGNLINLKSFSYLTILGLGLIILTRLYAYHTNSNVATENVRANLEFTENFDAWQYDPDRSLDWKPILNSTDITISKAYRFGDELVQLDIGYYHQQHHGIEAVSSNNKLTDPYDGDWKITSQVDYMQTHLYVSEIEIRKNGSKLLIWQWYRIGNLQTPNPLIAKIFDAYNKIINGRTDASYITIATIQESDKSSSRLRLNNFLENALSSINQRLEVASGQEK